MDSQRNFLGDRSGRAAGVGAKWMFNIVRRRDFMLGRDLPTRQEAEKLLTEKYGKDHIVVEAGEPVTNTKPAPSAAAR
jgi:hypothetical protein